EVATGTSATQSGSLGSATIIASVAANSLWEVKFSETQIAAGTSCSGNTTIQNQVTFTDPSSSSSTTLIVSQALISNNGTANKPIACGTAGCPGFLFQAKAGTSISIQTTYAAAGGCSPGPTYQTTYLLEQK